ncbi:S66 peptidase family protein [Crocinitomix algicola]|uniref:S66 peptidase family protein n=1 Tax=Crocinitomix algicola TaxID=1740263 RepID=UPI000871E4F8|nr:LD-carboxypeptidase [Crocinitomix algicola]
MKHIRILSPAKQIDEEAINFAVSYLKEKGFKVDVGNFAGGQYHYFSGTKDERFKDFQNALDDSSVDVILCARGGYGSVQIIDELDFTEFVKKPKLIVGYSDITVFHHHIFGQFNNPSLHATAPLNFKENTADSLDSLINALNGGVNSYSFDPQKYNIQGNAEGVVVGGNLAIVYSLIGTNSDVDFDNKILFLEEVGEALYSVDRMFYSLKKANKLKCLKGVVIGGMTNLKDSEIPYGKSVEEIIYDHVKPLNIPLGFNFPAGHIQDNRAVLIGKSAKIKIGRNESIFEQDCNIDLES